MQNHASSDPDQLLLIKAAAGSGKTHRLTGEYLNLLFSEENKYRFILAVTFTNKATDEMKSRIVDELHALASGEKSDYLNDLKTEFRLTEADVRKKSKTILENILHDYSSFSISTIDKFFQQTMRAFTREMGLSGGYKLEFDDKSILSQIIDLMIFELDMPQNKELSGWILDYMKNEIRDGKSWDVKRGIAKLSRELSNEKYKLLQRNSKENPQEKENLRAYRKTLMKIISSWENEMKSIARRALEIMGNHGLTYEDFKFGRNSGVGVVLKLANGEFKDKPSGRFQNLVDNLENWSGPKSPKKADLEEAYHAGLNDCFASIIEMYNNSIHYNSAKSIIQNFYALGILNDVKERLRLYQKENNTLFLSDTTELLNKIIADSDAPFVYEKTGTRIQNYMIDEFQDTSSLQWHNFRPLIGESLANGNFNLVVGDVKQSIYRWRNSDWNLLETEIEKDFRYNNISEVVLDTNWRSDSKIVHFNNQIFKSASRLMQESYNEESEINENHRITDAYKHVFQHVSPPRKDTSGHVKISFLDNSDKEYDWKTQALEQLPIEIENYQKQGFSLKDIAILVRKNDEAVEIAEFLLRYKEANPDTGFRYDIISNEALVIANAQSVKAAIALLRYFQNKKEDRLRMLAVYEYYRFLYGFSSEKALSTFFDKNGKDFPPEIRDELEKLSSLPFYEMIETFFSINNHVFDEKENVYVQAFLDIVLKFSSESSSNVNDFLEWWDDKGKDKALFSPDNQDAIRLMTIHKAKGLGFEVVIVPFLNWKTDHSGFSAPVLWCEPKEEPFNNIEFLPLFYRTGLKETIFREEYLEEKLLTYIDNLNLLYVAFTRAKKRILGFAPKPRSKKKEDLKVSDVSEVLWKAVHYSVSDYSVSLIDHLNESESEAVFEFGKPDREFKAKKPDEDNLFFSGKWNSIPFDDRLKMRLNSIGFFTDDGSRAYGTLMHEVISEISTLEQIDAAVEAGYISGELTADEKNEIILLLRETLSHPDVIDWYSGKYRVLNETDILLPSSTFSRPDRIMIGDDEVIVVDYKFGETEESKYRQQVEFYVRSIRQMGYANVKGYLFYVNKGKRYEIV